MDFSWHELMSFSETPLILFLILLVFTHLIYYRYFRYVPPATTNASMMMAIGIVAMECLPQFNTPIFIMLVIALELVVIWFYLAIRFSQAYLEEELVFNSLTDCIGIGTWVTGTSIIVLLLDEVEPTLHGFIVLLGLVAFILWIVYLVIVAKWVSFCVRKKLQVPSNAMFMLAAVSTQSIVLLFSALFHSDIPSWIYQGMILLGYIFYFIGLFMQLQHVVTMHAKHSVAAWFNPSHINHGALAITGLAVLNTQVFPDWLAMVTWWVTAVSIFIVLLFELYRLVMRIKMKGLLKGLWIYDVTQWSRIFTYGMFYAFTFAYHHQEHAENSIVLAIIDYGQYIVTFLLAMEIVLVVSHAMRIEREKEMRI